MRNFKKIALFLSFAACLNYGSISIFGYDIFKHLFFNFPFIQKFLYFCFGVAAFILLHQIEK